MRCALLCLKKHDRCAQPEAGRADAYLTNLSGHSVWTDKSDTGLHRQTSDIPVSAWRSGQGAEEQMMIGQQFGLLTVIDSAPTVGHNRMWKCRCACGKEIIARNDKLISGKKISCGCQSARRTVSPGDRFGKLVVVERQNDKWLCRCDCGEEKLISGSHLLSGNTRSCGCLTGKVKVEPGVKFGRLTVICEAEPEMDLDRNGRIKYIPKWLCRCECGKEREILRSVLVSGRIRSCGCLRGRRKAQKDNLSQ